MQNDGSQPLKAGPAFENKFKVLKAQEVIKSQLNELLSKQTYVPEAVSQTVPSLPRSHGGLFVCKNSLTKAGKTAILGM